MDKNFKVRLSCTIGMFAVALIGLYTFDSIPFKIIYGVFALISAIELGSFFKNGATGLRVTLAVLECIFLVFSSIFVARVDLSHFWLIILGVPGYDISAYVFGRLFGGKIFKKSRPFPKISKNKTWEGTILGLIFAVVAVAIALNAFGFTEYYYLACGPLALVGDLYESALKRTFKVKDSSEIIIKNKFFHMLEMIVGGSDGHGGFLDRIDSSAFTMTILFFIELVN